MDNLKAVAAALEASRYLRLKVKESSWDFVVSDQENATAVNISKLENGFLVII